MTTLANMRSFETLKFDSVDQQYANTTLSIIGLFAGLANGFIIYGGSRNSKATNTLLVLISLCYADTIMALFTAILAANNIAYGSWVGGQVSCILSKIITETTGLVSLLSMMTVSFLNYIKIFKGVRMADYIAKTIIAIIWIGSLVISTSVYMIADYREYVYLGTSKTACTIAWYKPSQFTRIAAFVTLAVILLGLHLLVAIECKLTNLLRYFHVQILSIQKSKTAHF
jgi:7 transmembrane receptor (rhodopsin family)